MVRSGVSRAYLSEHLNPVDEEAALVGTCSPLVNSGAKHVLERAAKRGRKGKPLHIMRRLGLTRYYRTSLDGEERRS